jgi:hypothetical protein
MLLNQLCSPSSAVEWRVWIAGAVEGFLVDEVSLNCDDGATDSGAFASAIAMRRRSRFRRHRGCDSGNFPTERTPPRPPPRPSSAAVLAEGDRARAQD